MTRYKLINGTKVQLTNEEEIARDKEEEKNKEAINLEIQKEEQRQTNKTSGKAKLKAGEALTDAEISALFGDN